ncbi:TfuA-like protein [Amycolatopsis halotolerans]|uniref:TfuA-like protein n=1 Tax=Amycolatopsis halotolerans TaxID=330083 RepID=A0ABV7QB68_9PSEU
MQHGDLFDPAICSGDSIVIVDGVYHQRPALRHKEILAAIGSGIRVIGAASIGALRAAELAPFGMLGVGRVYAAYASGEIYGDDEVAVGQSPDGRHALTWPLVNVRRVLDLALSAGVLDSKRTSKLLAKLREVFYPQRTLHAIRAIARMANEMDFFHWFTEQREQDPHFGDVKRSDALTAIRAATTRNLPQVIHGTTVWNTSCFQQWANTFSHVQVDEFDLFTEDRILYQQIFDPNFSGKWREYLNYRWRQSPEDASGISLDEHARRVTSGHLSAYQVFHPTVDVRDEVIVSILLDDETPQDRAAVSAYSDALAAERMRRPGFMTSSIRNDLTRDTLLRIWRCTDARFDASAASRGLKSGVRATEAAKRFIPGFLSEMKERRKELNG